MTAWVLFGICSLFAALGLLTVYRSPDRFGWMIAIAVDQFGHFLSIVPLGLGLLALFLPGARGPAVAACVAGVAGFVLLAQPCAQALRIGRFLPEKLARQFGPAGISGAAFSLAGLFGGSPSPVTVTTRTYSGSLQLDFYPAVGRSPAPCVIMIHGGGWDGGDRGQIPGFNHFLARGAIAVAAISYRLAPDATWPAQRDDVAAAVAFVKEHAGPWGIDPKRIVLVGRSAGGQIATASAYASRDPAIRGVVSLYAPADMNFAYEFGREDDVLKSPMLLRKFLGGTPQTAKAAYDSASGILLVGPGTPPTLMIHGLIDTLVWHQQSLRLAARLTAAGVPNLYLALPWATHALEYNLASPSGQLAAYAVRSFVLSVCR